MLKSLTSHPSKTCPFCLKAYKGLGIHLKHCSQRNGQDYQSYLSQKTLQKKASNSKKKPCEKCGKLFIRLDNHLRNSSTCRFLPVDSSSANVDASPQQESVQQDCVSSQTPVQSVSLPCKDPFNLPESTEAWGLADEHLASVVVPRVLAAGSVDDKHEVLCSGVYSYFNREHGTRSVPKKRKAQRQSKQDLSLIKLERNRARQQLRKAKRNSSDPDTLKDLARKFHLYLRKFSKLKRAEVRHTNKVHEDHARKECCCNFWRFAAKVLGGGEGESELQPNFDVNTAQSYFTNVYSSHQRVFTQPAWLPSAPDPHVPFNTDPISTEELQHIIKKAHAKSSPSPLDQIPYLIFKKCPSLTAALIDLYSMCWEQGLVPRGWKEGVIRLLPKPAAAQDSLSPSNFRPIALTSCVGKIFTTLLKNRWLSFITNNGYLDTSIQKAFLPGMPGCLEHCQKLTAAINEAHRKHRSLTVCWIDLANAYGSVHHGLISYALQHYHAPPQFLRVVSSIYTDLSAIVTCKKWSTNTIPLHLGVYQGDPLSVAIFNTVMATLADTLKADHSLGYRFSNSPREMSILQYADDTCLVANGPASCQQMLHKVERWLDWTGMEAKVPKCFSLAIAASSGKRYDPKLKMCGESIPVIANKSIKFLGCPIMVPHTNSHHKKYLEEKLEQLLQRVEQVPVTGKQKLLLYKAGICPRLNWDLGIMDLPISWVNTTLEARATHFLKKWSGFAKSADPSRLYLPKSEGGLQLPPLTLLYKKLKASQASLMLTSRDRVVQHVASKKIQSEENQLRVAFKPMVTVRDVMATDPGMNRRGLTQRSKALLATEDADKRLEHAQSLPRQGELLRDTPDLAAEIWSSAVQSLSSVALKFILNATTDTLPHNSNLSLWGRSAVSRNCKLCGQHQTLVHVLNHCPVALRLRRYNHRHDAVLRVMADLMKAHISPSQNLMIDIPETSYHFPLHIINTDSRPDILLWQDDTREITLLELTVCFETNFEEAKRRKTSRYADLLDEAENNGYKASLITIEVGSRGVLNVAGLEKLKSLLNVEKKEWTTFMMNLVVTVIKESHKIWVARNWSENT